MTTNSYSAVVDQSTDAGFRAWGSTLSTAFAAAGLVQTADTGQINWSTVVRASAGAIAGYEIWRLPSSALFYKIEYGSGGNGITYPNIVITIGTGSNGTGSLTGQQSTRQSVMSGGFIFNASPASASLPNYICVTNDYFGFAFAVSISQSKMYGCFMSGTTVDNTGARSTLGYWGCWAYTNGCLAMQCVRTQASAVTLGFQLTNNFSLKVAAVTSSVLQSGVFQAYPCFGNFPEVLPLGQIGQVLATEASTGSTIACVFVGTTNRTFLVLTGVGNASPSYGFDNSLNLATYPLMLYE